MSLLKGEDFEQEKYFVSVFNRGRGIVDGDWKLVNYYDGPFELYNLINDPSETNNLANENTEILNEMIAQWEEYATTHGFANDKSWNRPVGDVTRGWGYDFMRTGVVKSVPECMSEDVNVDTKLTLTFAGKITFANTANKTIRLQKYGVPGYIWSADPGTSNQYEGKTVITFHDFPKLDPNSHYNIIWDAGWVKYEKDGKWANIPSVKESAYSYRFKTGDGASSQIQRENMRNNVHVYPNPTNGDVSIRVD